MYTMEEVRRKPKLLEVSFKASNKDSISKGCSRSKSKDKISTMDQKHLSANEGIYGIHEPPLMESFKSPNNAMEFLCRPWSPSASHLLQRFSSMNQLLPINDRHGMEDQEDQLEDTLNSTKETNTTLAFSGTRKIHFNHLKGWLKGKQLTSIFRPDKEKRKEELRFHTARLDAALSITRLSAAIAGFTTSLCTGLHDIDPKNNGTSGFQYEGMENLVAMAATLMTTVCAEAAESLGANRAQVESAVNSGVAITNPNDMITVTATAATCLRGAKILKSRRAEEAIPRIKDMLGALNQICVITPSGRKEYRFVTVYSKHKHLILCIQQKHFGGTITTSKEHKILQIKEAMEGEGLFFLTLTTNNGEIRLLFEEEKQLRIWKLTINNLVKLHNPRHLSGSPEV